MIATHNGNHKAAQLLKGFEDAEGEKVMQAFEETVELVTDEPEDEVLPSFRIQRLSAWKKAKRAMNMMDAKNKVSRKRHMVST